MSILHQIIAHTPYFVCPTGDFMVVLCKWDNGDFTTHAQYRNGKFAENSSKYFGNNLQPAMKFWLGQINFLSSFSEVIE